MAKSDPYPEIGEMLAAAASGPWETIVLKAEVGEDWGRFSATSFAKRLPSESLDVRAESRLLVLLQKVRQITSMKVAPGKPSWRTIALTLHSNGKFENRVRLLSQARDRTVDAIRRGLLGEGNEWKSYLFRLLRSRHRRRSNSLGYGQSMAHNMCPLPPDCGPIQVRGA